MHRRVMTVVSQVAELGVFVAAAAALGAGLMAPLTAPRGQCPDEPGAVGCGIPLPVHSHG